MLQKTFRFKLEASTANVPLIETMIMIQPMQGHAWLCQNPVTTMSLDEPEIRDFNINAFASHEAAPPSIQNGPHRMEAIGNRDNASSCADLRHVSPI
jgi:hypothetical protein